MRGKKIPEIYRNVQNSSITLTYGQPKCTLIWLHGLGDSSEGFLSFFTHSHSPLYENVKIKLIQAPLRNITINNGQVSHSWYDIKSLNRFKGKEKDVFNMDDVKQSCEIVQEHVQEEAVQMYKKQPDALISPYHKIFIGGFSQGGVISLKYGLETKNIPAGLISFSGYLLKSTELINFRKVPMLLMHGQNDSAIPSSDSKDSYKELLNDERLVEYSCLPNMDHTVSLEQLDSLKKWLKQINEMINRIYSNKNHVR